VKPGGEERKASPRIPQSHRLPSSRMGEDQYRHGRQAARRRLRRACQRRRELHLLCERAEGVGPRNLHKFKPTCERGGGQVEPIRLRRAHAVNEERMQRPSWRHLAGQRVDAVERRAASLGRTGAGGAARAERKERETMAKKGVGGIGSECRMYNFRSVGPVTYIDWRFSFVLPENSCFPRACLEKRR
jgi:hypothetical protein